jgi:hypothetical protein
VAQAKTWRAVMTFEKGRAKVTHTGVHELVSLGPGNVMYFVLLVRRPMLPLSLDARTLTAAAAVCRAQKQLAITMVVMTVVAVPLLHFAFTGNGIISRDEIGVCCGSGSMPECARSCRRSRCVRVPVCAGISRLSLGNAGLRPHVNYNASFLIFPLSGGMPGGLTRAVALR